MPEEKVTDIRLRPWNTKTGKGAVAHGSFKLFGMIRIDCTVVNGSKGLFVSLPRKQYEKDGEKRYRNTIFIEDKDLMDEVKTAVLEQYNKEVGDTTSSDENYPY